MKNESGITPTGNHVLVYPIEKPKETESGLVIPEMVRSSRGNAQTFAYVVETGPDCWTDFGGPWGAAGDKVIIAKYAGIKLLGGDDKEYRIINDLDVTAVVGADVKLPGEEDL